ncbi:unnamed protein product [Amoebophrya sp. A120]|nr:unnamed protein product [Amoebophrya sp. A120]|eukprot:GSA120T00018035001.1
MLKKRTLDYDRTLGPVIAKVRDLVSNSGAVLGKVAASEAQEVQVDKRSQATSTRGGGTHQLQEQATLHKADCFWGVFGEDVSCMSTRAGKDQDELRTQCPPELWNQLLSVKPLVAIGNFGTETMLQLRHQDSDRARMQKQKEAHQQTSTILTGQSHASVVRASDDGKEFSPSYLRFRDCFVSCALELDLAQLAVDGTGAGSFFDEYLTDAIGSAHSSQNLPDSAEYDIEMRSSSTTFLTTPRPPYLGSVLLDTVRRECLQLSTFYTAGEMEARSWSYPNTWKACAASSVIHRDFPRQFNAALVWNFSDVLRAGGKTMEGRTKVTKEHVLPNNAIVEFQLSNQNKPANKPSFQFSSQQVSK